MVWIEGRRSGGNGEEGKDGHVGEGCARERCTCGVLVEGMEEDVGIGAHVGIGGSERGDGGG